MNKERTVRDEGYAAFIADVPYGECPYPKGEQRDQWEDGWLDASEDRIQMSYDYTGEDVEG